MLTLTKVGLERTTALITESDSSSQNFCFSFCVSFLAYSSNTTSISVLLSCQHSWRTNGVHSVTVSVEVVFTGIVKVIVFDVDGL